MQYIFPKQYGLHNVLTTTADPKRVSQLYQDYASREEEIRTKIWTLKRRPAATLSSRDHPAQLPLPNRLKGKPLALVAKFQRLHSRCSYTELLRYYCPVQKDAFLHRTSSQQDRLGFMEFAMPATCVSAFCRAVITRAVPLESWGHTEIAFQNRASVLRHVDQFVRLRRHETLTMHDVLDGIKVCVMVRAVACSTDRLLDSRHLLARAPWSRPNL
jgi:telomerase reverse transcriptase